MGTHLNAAVTSSEDEQSPDIQKKSAEESEIKEEAKEVKPKKKADVPTVHYTSPINPRITVIFHVFLFFE